MLLLSATKCSCKVLLLLSAPAATDSASSWNGQEAEGRGHKIARLPQPSQPRREAARRPREPPAFSETSSHSRHSSCTQNYAIPRDRSVYLSDGCVQRSVDYHPRAHPILTPTFAPTCTFTLSHSQPLSLPHIKPDHNMWAITHLSTSGSFASISSLLFVCLALGVGILCEPY